MGDSDSDDDGPTLKSPSKWRSNMTAVVAANKMARIAAEKAAQEQAETLRKESEEEAANKALVVGSHDAQHAEARVNSVTRQALAAREDRKKRTAEYYARMEKVRAVQQSAAKSAHGNAEKLQSRLRATRRSKELMRDDDEKPSAST